MENDWVEYDLVGEYRGTANVTWLEPDISAVLEIRGIPEWAVDAELYQATWYEYDWMW